MAKGDYIPEGDANFDTWVDNFVKYVVSNAASLGLTAAEVTELQTLYNRWKISYPAHINAKNASKSATKNKVATKDEFEVLTRRVVRKIQARPETTNSQRENMDIPVKDVIRTILSEEIILSVPPPQIDVLCTAPKQVKIDWYPSPVGTDSSAKPKGIDGVIIWYAEGGIPTDEKEWRFLAMDSNSPHIHNVGNDATVTLAYKAQWFDKRKRRGSFCDPVIVAVTP
ncbi:MAG: hypothetical protein HY769_10590 [Candidatus Stahlbacteria bacterium]|nr:hypothetical protein [Candidatus Stahlbacteria bacterium]